MLSAKQHIASTIAIGMMAVVLSSCRKEVRLRADAVEDRAGMPALDSRHITTLISDSGVIRYKIVAERWRVFDRAKPPYWEFPDGVYLEQFNSAQRVVTSLKADYAYYDREAQIWRLDGNVHSQNRAGEQFDTPQLFWNQKTERVYSDTTIKITKETSIISGVGFDSNQEMTQYTIQHPTGIIPLKDEE